MDDAGDSCAEYGNSACITLELGQKETACVSVMCVAVVAMSFLLSKQFGVRQSVEHERIDTDHEMALKTDTSVQEATWKQVIEKELFDVIMTVMVGVCVLRPISGPTNTWCDYLQTMMVFGLTATTKKAVILMSGKLQ